MKDSRVDAEGRGERVLVLEGTADAVVSGEGEVEADGGCERVGATVPLARGDGESEEVGKGVVVAAIEANDVGDTAAVAPDEGETSVEGEARTLPLPSFVTLTLPEVEGQADDVLVAPEDRELVIESEPVGLVRGEREALRLAAPEFEAETLKVGIREPVPEAEMAGVRDSDMDKRGVRVGSGVPEEETDTLMLGDTLGDAVSLADAVAKEAVAIPDRVIDTVTVPLGEREMSGEALGEATALVDTVTIGEIELADERDGESVRREKCAEEDAEYTGVSETVVEELPDTERLKEGDLVGRGVPLLDRETAGEREAEGEALFETETPLEREGDAEELLLTERAGEAVLEAERTDETEGRELVDKRDETDALHVGAKVSVTAGVLVTSGLELAVLLTTLLADNVPVEEVLGLVHSEPLGEIVAPVSEARGVVVLHPLTVALEKEDALTPPLAVAMLAVGDPLAQLLAVSVPVPLTLDERMAEAEGTALGEASAVPLTLSVGLELREGKGEPLEELVAFTLRLARLLPLTVPETGAEIEGVNIELVEAVKLLVLEVEGGGLPEGDMEVVAQAEAGAEGEAAALMVGHEEMEAHREGELEGEPDRVEAPLAVATEGVPEGEKAPLAVVTEGVPEGEDAPLIEAKLIVAQTV